MIEILHYLLVLWTTLLGVVVGWTLCAISEDRERKRHRRYRVDLVTIASSSEETTALVSERIKKNDSLRG